MSALSMVSDQCRVVCDELRVHWKPATAMVAVAIVVTAIWGKIALAGMGLVAFTSYLALGPSVRVMRFVDLRNFLVVTALLGNGYFQVVPAAWLNYYAAVCMLAREWNFWDIHSRLTTHASELKSHNNGLEAKFKKLGDGVKALENQFINVHTAALPAHQAQISYRQGARDVKVSIEQEVNSIEQALSRVSELAEAVLNDENARQLFATYTQVQAKRDVLVQEQAQLTANCNNLLQQLQSLNLRMHEAVTTLEGQEILKAEQVQKLKNAITILQPLKGSIR